ncbi:MAG: beta-galactosidase [Pseudomonadota bacterium]
MLGVCYYPEQWDESRWADDASRMAEMGLTYVRIAEFAWARMEPEDGRFEWEWLDRAVDTLANAGLKVVLGTPTATPPYWLIAKHPEILPVGSDGRQRGFGSRRHSTFSSAVFRREARRIVDAMATRYGNHPGVAGWQTDNEYGCHETARSYGDLDREAFQVWLAERYGSIGSLNEAWGNVFWSMEYPEFTAIGLPNEPVTEPNPSHALDFARFCSDMVVSFNKEQTDILRAKSPGRFITHNFMQRTLTFDHFRMSEDLDLASWDSYPLGKLEVIFDSEADTEIKNRYARVGHPDGASFHHDLYKGVGNGRFWVMEQQPGPVNWAPWNPAPAEGAVRLWTWEALAHGAEVVSYFRWRQPPFAQEQMHTGLHRPDDSMDFGGAEAIQVARELATISLDPPTRSPVALLFDYQTAWAYEVQPQGIDFDYFRLCFDWYSAARRLGLDVDIVGPGRDLAGYELVLVPSLALAENKVWQRLIAHKGAILYGPRTGSKTLNMSIPETLPPGPLAEALPIRMLQVESLRPGLTRTLRIGNRQGRAIRWAERLETELNADILFDDGSPALVRNKGQRYLACWPDEDTLREIISNLARETGLKTLSLPDGLRVQRRGALTFAFNRNEDSVEAPAPSNAEFVLGTRTIPAAGVAAWR